MSTLTEQKILVLLKQRLTASEWKWPVCWAEVHGEERMTSLQTSEWEATLTEEILDIPVNLQQGVIKDFSVKLLL